MELNQEALLSAYAAVPVDKRDANLIATAIRAYVDAAFRDAPTDGSVRAMESALSALKVLGTGPVTATPIALLSEELARRASAGKKPTD